MSAKFNIDISEQESKTVINAIVDILSLPRESLGYLGDLIRIHRANTILKCFKKTKTLAEEAGLKLSAPPIKFLAQYVESASLEDEQDEKMIEWWSNLLLEASTNYTHENVFFANLLKQLSARELDLLEILVRNSSLDTRLANVFDAKFSQDFFFVKNNYSLVATPDQNSVETSIESIVAAHEINAGTLVFDVFVDGEIDGEYLQWQYFNEDYNQRESSYWQILESLQLVSIQRDKFISAGLEYRTHVASITDLGAEFYFSCHSPGWVDFNAKGKKYVRSTTVPDKDELHMTRLT